MGDLLSRFRYPLTYLLLGLLCAVSMASRREPLPLGPASRVVLDLTLPLQQMVTLPLREVQDLWRGYVALVGLRVENERLTGEVARLEEEVLQYREAIVSSERFQRLAAAASVEAATAKILSQVQPAASGPKEWLTNREAMDFLGLSKTSLQRYRASGLLRFSKIGGNIYYKYSDLVAVLEANLVK